MKIRYLTAAGVIATMVALAGCQPDDTWDDDPATTDTWGDRTDETEPAQAPPPGTADGAQQTWQYDPQTQETEQVGQQQPGQTDPMGTQSDAMDQQRGEADVDMTEFAALDTDATGTITEEQWVPEAVGGAEFSEVDRDGDGVVTREEFRQYFMEEGAGTTRPGAGADRGAAGSGAGAGAGAGAAGQGTQQ